MYGLRAIIDDTAALYVRDDTPNAEPRYRARFYFDPNSITMAEGDAHDILIGYHSSSSSAFKVYLRRSGGAYQVVANIYRDDASGWGSSGYTLSDAPHYLEVDWKAASSAGANDGYLALWLDGVQQTTLANVDNDTLWIDYVLLGPSGGIDAGTSGTEYFDAFESRRSTYLGPAGGRAPGGRFFAPARVPDRDNRLFTWLLDLLRRAVASVRVNSMLAAPPQGQTWKVYYYAGSQRVAMRELTTTGDTLYFLHADHLGSTSLTTDSNGNRVGELKYYPFGQTRSTWGSTPTDRRFTGQVSEESTLGSLYFYNARYYSPGIIRFISADTIVPDPTNPQTLNRYAYAYNNPVNYTDPDGHCPKPPSGLGSGNIICLAAFIPTLNSQATPLYYFQGDNRDFSAEGDSTTESSRFWIWIDADTGERLGGDVHDTCSANGCWAPNDEYNKINVLKSKDGTISVDFKIICSAAILCAFGPEGVVKFTPNTNGGYDTNFSGEGFPNYEAYHWKDGQLQSPYLLRIQNFSPEELSNGVAQMGTGLRMISSKVTASTTSGPGRVFGAETTDLNLGNGFDYHKAISALQVSYVLENYFGVKLP